MMEDHGGRRSGLGATCAKRRPRGSEERCAAEDQAHYGHLAAQPRRSTVMVQIA